MHCLKFFLLLFVLMISPKALMAQEAAPARHVQIRLLAERGVIGAGEEIWIGVEQSIAPGWHTYWKNPGDSGTAPRIKWDLPDGFALSETHWPAPHKLPYGPLLNYGYEDHAILLQKLKAPEILPDGPLSLSADIEILVCKAECIPEYGTYKLSLNGPGGQEEDNHAYLGDARAKLPLKTGWAVGFTEEEGRLALDFSAPQAFDFTDIDLKSIALFPYEWGLISNQAALQARLEKGVLTLTQMRGDRPLSAVETLRGVLTYRSPAGDRQAIEFLAKYGQNKAGRSNFTIPSAEGANHKNGSLIQVEQTGLVRALFLALFGGMILNLMPCVFPVLSIKALSLVKIAEKHPEQARLHGLAYTGGVLLSFLIIAGLLIGLMAAGAQIGWGFQLQSPVVVTLLAYLLFIIGLNFSGLFEIGGGLANIGGTLTRGRGYTNSFLIGILATLVATPCTAPFMGVAIGYALLQPGIVSLGIFTALGFGLALPYLLLSFLPGLQHLLPRPGAWMESFKQFLAFPMYASSAWLIGVLTQQAGPMGTLGALFGLVAIAFGFWLLSHRPKGRGGRLFVIILTLCAFSSAIFFLPAQSAKDPAGALIPARFGEAYSPETLEALLKTSAPVFVEMTAAWCITCKINHALAMNVKSTKALFAEKNIRYLVGDWTNQDRVVTKYLDSFGRNGVPLYIYYAPPDSSGQRPAPAVLPQLLTPAIITKFVNEVS